METNKTTTYRDNIFLDIVEEFGDGKHSIFEISNYDYHINGALVTHLSITDDMCDGVIAGQPNTTEFWDYHYEQLSLSNDEWNEIIEIAKDIIL